MTRIIVATKETGEDRAAKRLQEHRDAQAKRLGPNGISAVNAESRQARRFRLRQEDKMKRATLNQEAKRQAQREERLNRYPRR